MAYCAHTVCYNLPCFPRIFSFSIPSFSPPREVLHDVLVVQLLEQRHHAESRARHALVLALELDLLESGLLAGDLVRGDVHLAEGALAQLLAPLPQLDLFFLRLKFIA